MIICKFVCLIRIMVSNGEPVFFIKIRAGEPDIGWVVGQCYLQYHLFRYPCKCVEQFQIPP